MGGVPYLEIDLKPVGRTVKPNNPSQLQAALLCLLHCVKLLHCLQYLHTDIRWGNIVEFQNLWILIDCYDFCKFDDSARRFATKRLRIKGAVTDSPWEVEDDLAQVLALVSDEAFRGHEYVSFRCLLTTSMITQVASGEMAVDGLIATIEHLVI